MKRCSDALATPSPIKKASMSETGPVLEQGRIYFSPIGGITVPRAETTGSISLTEIIAFIKPINSLHLSYIMDFKYLYSCYPILQRDMPMTLVVGEKDAKSLEQDIYSFSNVQVLGAPLPIPFGVHHTKMSIFESADGKVHVLIYTANFTTEEWEFKTQQFYYAYGLKKEDSAEIVERSCFQDDLIVYLGQYRHLLTKWRDLISRVDFTEIADRLIYSTPGRFTHVAAQSLGHPLLKKRLSEKFPKVESVEPQEKSTYIAQCNSIGSLGPQPGSWFRGQFLESLEGNNPSGPNSLPNLRLIFPCVEDVRKSCRGYISGTSIPYRMSVHNRQKWLDTCRILCKWRAHTNNRSLAMPHCKSYVKYHNRLPQWQLMTSANLSKAAWGEYNKERNSIFIRSYEMGVLITDPLRFNIPFDYPLVPYSPTDDPFTIDTCHWEKDIFDNSFSPLGTGDNLS